MSRAIVLAGVLAAPLSAFAADTAPPTIQHLPCTSFQAGLDFTIRAKVVDESSVLGAVVYRVGDGGWRTASLLPESGQILSALIPGAVLTATLSYYIEVGDALGNGPALLASASEPMVVQPNEGPVTCEQIPSAVTVPDSARELYDTGPGPGTTEEHLERKPVAQPKTPSRDPRLRPGYQPPPPPRQRDVGELPVPVERRGGYEDYRRRRRGRRQARRSRVPRPDVRFHPMPNRGLGFKIGGGAMTAGSLVALGFSTWLMVEIAESDDSVFGSGFGRDTADGFLAFFGVLLAVLPRLASAMLTWGGTTLYNKGTVIAEVGEGGEIRSIIPGWVAWVTLIGSLGAWLASAEVDFDQKPIAHGFHGVLSGISTLVWLINMGSPAKPIPDSVRRTSRRPISVLPVPMLLKDRDDTVPGLGLAVQF